VASDAGCWRPSCPSRSSAQRALACIRTRSSTEAGKDTNAFYDRADQYQLSTVAKHFIAGFFSWPMPRALRAGGATRDSYKRFVAGFEAPVAISWGAPRP